MGSPETCPVCEDFAAACRHPAHYATPPAPADDDALVKERDEATRKWNAAVYDADKVRVERDRAEREWHAATARADKAEAELLRWERSFSGHVYVTNEKYSELVALLREAYDAILGEADFPLKERIKAFLMEKANG